MGFSQHPDCPTTPAPEPSPEQQAVSVFDDKKGLLVIKEVNAAGLVYYVELQDQGEFQFLLTKVTGLSDSVHKTPASYSFESLLVDIPSVFAFGKLYTVQMKNNGSNVFFITKVEVE